MKAALSLGITIALLLAGCSPTGKTTEQSFEELCKSQGKEWMKMMPMIDGIPTGEPPCWGCMANKNTHICNMEEYLAFGGK